MRVILIAILLFGFAGCSTNGKTEVETSYTAEDIYKLAEQSFFYIRVLQNDDRVKSVGTGFFLLSDEKYAVTAYHVVEDAEQIEIIMNDQHIISDVDILTYDKTKDVAILKLPVEERGEKDGGLEIRKSPVTFGEEVFAIGFPLKETPIITRGIVNNPSALINGRNRILTSAEIASGMSGGPVLDTNGQIVGLISGSLRTINNIHLVVDKEDIVSVLNEQ